MKKEKSVRLQSLLTVDDPCSFFPLFITIVVITIILVLLLFFVHLTKCAHHCSFEFLVFAFGLDIDFQCLVSIRVRCIRVIGQNVGVVAWPGQTTTSHPLQEASNFGDIGWVWRKKTSSCGNGVLRIIFLLLDRQSLLHNIALLSSRSSNWKPWPITRSASATSTCWAGFASW